MKQTRFSLVADAVFYSVCAFVLVLCILRYYEVSLPVSCTVAALVALAVAGICALLLYGGNRRRLLTRKEREAKDALMLHLALEKPERVRSALKQALEADGKEVMEREGVLVAEGVALLPLTKIEPVTADEIAAQLRSFGEENFTVVCNSLTAEAEKLLRSFGKGAMCGDELYALFKRSGMPEPLICGQLPKRTLKMKWRRSFSKSNARPFLVSGLLLSVMSLFTFFPVYYLVSGSLLLLTAVLVRVFGYS